MTAAQRRLPRLTRLTRRLRSGPGGRFAGRLTKAAPTGTAAFVILVGAAVSTRAATTLL